MFIGGTDIEAETPILWPPDAKSWLIGKDTDAGKKLKAGGEGDDRVWDGWMASLTQWTWVWINSGSWWWTGRPSVLQFRGFKSQTLLRDWTELKLKDNINLFQNSHAHTATLRAPSPAASHCWPMPPPQTPGHSRASLGQSLVESLILSPGSWCAQSFVCALQESVSPVLCKFWWWG